VKCSVNVCNYQQIYVIISVGEKLFINGWNCQYSWESGYIGVKSQFKVHSGLTLSYLVMFTSIKIDIASKGVKDISDYEKLSVS